MTPMHAQTASPSRRRCVLLLVALACLALLLAPTLAAAKSQKQPRPLYWGAVIGSQLTGTAAPWDINAVHQFEGITGKGPSIVSFSAPFTECATDACSFFPFPTVAMESLREEGIVPMMSWASQSIPSSLDEPAYQLR